MHFTLPAALLMFAFGLLIYIGEFLSLSAAGASRCQRRDGGDCGVRRPDACRISLSAEQFKVLAIFYTAQTSLVTFFVLLGALIMVFAEPPLRWFAGACLIVAIGSWRGRGLVLHLVAYYLLLPPPGLRAFFELVPLPLFFHLAILVMTVGWALLLRTMWRRRWLGRFLISQNRKRKGGAGGARAEQAEDATGSFGDRILSVETEVSRFDRWVEFVVADRALAGDCRHRVVGYQAALWGGEQTQHSAAANVAYVQSAKMSNQALQMTSLLLQPFCRLGVGGQRRELGNWPIFCTHAFRRSLKSPPTPGSPPSRCRTQMRRPRPLSWPSINWRKTHKRRNYNNRLKPKRGLPTGPTRFPTATSC